MTESVSKETEILALSYFPTRIKEALRICCRRAGGVISEIRLSAGAEIFLTVDDKCIATNTVCTEDDMRYIVRSLCGNSMYSHSESIKEGFITTSEGVRAGVAGRAVTEGGKITLVSDISSIVLRIPRRFPGAANDFFSHMDNMKWQGSALIYSPPGGGKTTLLRELVCMLTDASHYKRAAVVDSRNEICVGLSKGNCSVLSGYPRSKGIEIALRTLSPDIIICDEISTDDDAAAAVSCLGSGVTLIASVHGTHDDVFSRRIVKELLPHKLFKVYYGVFKNKEKLGGRVTYAKDVRY